MASVNGRPFLLLIVSFVLLLVHSECAQVNSLNPPEGSVNGEVKLTLGGSGFAKNLFNHGEGNTNLGNKVTLVSDTKQFNCEIHKDGTHETQIQCHAPPMPVDTYGIKLAIDGNDVDDSNICRNCKFSPSLTNTPTIDTVEPRSGPPGTIVKFYGKIFSDKFGSNIDESSNGRTAQILRVYVGGQLCELKNNDDFYGIQLDNNGNSDYGYIKCKIGESGTKIGNVNGSFIISGEFGRSQPSKDLYHVSRNYQLHMFQTYAEITSVSPATGSVEGGTLISITGKNFDQTRTSAVATVGGTPCEIKSVSKTLIKCETKAKPASIPVTNAGNRGLKLEIWNATTKTEALLPEVAALDSSAADYFAGSLEDAYYTDSTMDNMVTKISGFLVPPFTGEYSFHVSADDDMQLHFSSDDNPSNMAKIASTETTLSKSSSRISLNKDNKYYMEVYHREVTSNAFAKVSARYYNTNLTSAYTDTIKAETQKIGVVSTIIKEKQSLTFSGFTNGSSTSTVQKVTVEEKVSGTGGTLRLGLYNTWTDLINYREESSNLRTIIQNMPFFERGESVSITDVASANGIEYTITITSERGDFPVFATEATDSLTVAVTKTTTGTPKGTVVSVFMAGVPAPLIGPDASSGKVQESMDGLFSTRCPGPIKNPAGQIVHHFTFETTASSSTPSHNRNYRYSEIEAFCGKYVLKNPRFLISGTNETVSLTRGPKMCMAHQGVIGSNLKIWYEYKKNATLTVDSATILENVITTSGNTGWQYSCVDILSKLQGMISGSSFMLKKVMIYRTDDVYIDEVYFGTTEPTTDAEITRQRLKPPTPNGVRVDSVSVAQVSGSHHITFTAFNCGNGIPLFTSESTQTPVGADVTVSRIAAASPPIGGNFSLTFLGTTLSAIPVDIETSALAANLETIEGLNQVSVTKEGNCANFNWLIEFTSLPGDQLLIQLDASKVTGESVFMTPEVVTDGHVVFDPIPGEFLRFPTAKPQVVIMNNDIPTKCSGNCDFEWLPSSTPTVTGISPGTGVPGTVTTISGTRFSVTPADNTVVIGNAPCNVTASTATSITCTIGNGPKGIYRANVTVAGLGLAQHSSGDVSYIYSTGIDSFSPASSSLGGGINLTVEGYGFRNDATVTVGGQDCPVVSRSTAQLVCVIPPTTSAGSVSVAVAMTGVPSSSASGSFSYDNSITAQVTSITPTSSGVKGGATCTITGSGFGADASAGTLKIGGTTLTPLNYSDTQVTATLPLLAPGIQPVQLIVGTNGAAVLTSSNEVPSINYNLKVTNVFPLQGSLSGGTFITITGVGLDPETEVMIGGNPCEMETFVSATQIVCKAGDTGQTHEVTNQGTHFAFGVGYAWEPRNLQVRQGDTVRWNWYYPTWVSGMTPRVQQVKNASSTEEEPDGFTSGPAGTKQGAFEFRFNTLGTSYYWSDYVDAYTTTWFRGSVHVTGRESFVGDVSVKVGGIEAVYDKNSGVSNPSDSSPCVGTLNTISGCTDAAPTGGDPTKFNFKFWSCLTPTVTAINRNNGTANDDVVLTGTGLSSTSCQNEVNFGGNVCTVSSGSSTSVTCRLDSTNSPPIGVQQAVDVRVGNLGNARIAIPGQLTRTFAAIPVVSSFTPTIGSLEGNTQVTITGAGFQGSIPDVDVTVTVGGYACPISSFSYTSIVCSTPKSITDGAKVMEVKVKAGVQMVPAGCDANSCDFTYDLASTASVESVSPTTLDGSSTTLTITGKRFSTNGMSVTVGGEVCTVTSASSTAVECTISAVPVGAQPLIVDSEKGRAEHDPSPFTVTGQAAITSVSPSAGSTNGGTDVTITGNGFVQGSTVTIDSTNCPVASVSLSQIVCRTAAHVAGNDLDLIVTSGSTTYTAEDFSFTVPATPVISSLTPTSGSSGDTVTLSGANFGATIADNTVTLGGRECSLTSASATEIVFTVGDYQAGSYAVLVDVSGSGLSNNDKVFTFNMTASSISPNAGSTNGDQTVTISGSGFDNTTEVTICSQSCVRSTTQSSTATQFICVTPAASGTTTQACSVVVTTNSVTETLSYTYDSTKTPETTGVTPTRGGTGGGTRITVSGAGFGNTKSDCSVSIEGSVCVVDSVSNTQVVCDTGSIPYSVRGKVRVEIAGNGKAIQTLADFHYVDVWSSVFTWGGVSLPTDGDLVVIQAGQTIYLDTTTARLKMLLIQGGEFIFDDNQDVELNSEIILVTNGGLFQVGTEQEHFQHKATITLYGHPRSKELPIYGTKTLAIREGTLDLHGIPTPVTWTNLAETATAGTNVIKLEQAVNWNVGDKIVIPSTGDFKSQSQNEQKTITAIAADQKTLTLDSALEFEHIAVTETFGTSSNAATVTFAAEVGLLSHNIKVQGNSDPQWIEKIEACPDGFDTGEFAVQTCFQGRFGEEMGSDQFGGQVMIHAPEYDTHRSTGRLEYVEFFHMGQAFRLGRYPVHFHLNGDMSHSYVRGCGIHETFNRAVNIHGTHNMLLEHTVIFNIMGGAFFLEDGIEHGNTMQYNLATFVRESSSLLNDDVTPASFWATNPNNTIQHNHAAGGTHFGFWYRMHTHPEGPSFTETVCPKLIPLGSFYNNSAHSFGWFGLWIFPTYTPREHGICTSTTSTPSVFDTFVAWNNEKGSETVNTGALQFNNFIAVGNKKAGFEGKLIVEGEDLSNPSNEPGLWNSLIVGHASFSGSSQCTNGGVVLPYGFGFQTNNVEFVNFDRSSCSAFTWTRIDGTCSDQCAGFYYKTYALTWTNSPNRGRFAWPFEGVLEDQDGTLCNSVRCKVLPTIGTLPPSCVNYPEFNFGIPASVCPASVKFHRFGFNDIRPESLNFKQANWTNQYGFSLAEHRDKRITHKKGWVQLLVSGETYTLGFVDAATQTNLSFSGTIYHMENNDHIFLRQKVNKKPDRLKSSSRGFVESSDAPLDVTTHRDGDWSFDHYTNEITILFMNSDSGARRKKRGSPALSAGATSISFNFQAFKCFYTNCTPPPDPNTVPPVTQRPNDFDYWSEPNSWTWLNNTLPVAGTDLTIPLDVWMVADMAIPSFNQVILYGTLEFDHGTSAPYRDINLSATHIIILGGRLIIGWPDRPYLGNAQVILRGNWQTPEYTELTNAPTVGAKAIAVFGGLDLHGIDVGVSWTRLATTAAAGANTITLERAVNWTAGNEIVIAPTSYDMWETETFSISSVSQDGLTLTLNSSLSYTHVVHTETIGNTVVDLRAEVGLLTRNVKIVGEDYDKMFEESFGARTLVGIAQKGTSEYLGYARVSNVEFVHTGQEGYTEFYDARFSLTFLDCGTVSNIKPSYVKSCAFHNGFSPAVGVYGTDNLLIEDNVIHHTVSWGIETSSADTQLFRNFVILVIWEGAYQDRQESFNYRHNAAFNVMNAKNIVIEDNVVAGSERAGYRINAEECGSFGYGKNLVHSSLMGVGIYPEDELTVSCVQISNFTAWKCRDSGIYYENSLSLEMRDVLLVENTVGSAPFVIGPSAVQHIFADLYVSIKDSTVIGATSSFDCTNDRLKSDDNILFSDQARTWNLGGNHLGLAFPLFFQSSNNMPRKPHFGSMSYPTISGRTHLDGVTFAHFKTTCGMNDYAYSTNGKGGDDGFHPVHSKNIVLEDVAEANKYFCNRPNVGKINGADCVDMDCDGFKKALFDDIDGSFLGSPGAIIPESEWEWGGDPRRGLGDYRIPKTMLTELDGTRIPVNDIAPNKGIIRNTDCQYMTAWQAYKCHDLNYKMLIIESLDSDTETRRISPVAILGDGYIDLINGPQDHGWCSGYTCRKRVSTFMALVAIGKEYLVHYSGTTPQDMRYYLLNSNDNESIKLAVWYSQPNRRDVSVDSKIVPPKNGRTVNDRYILDPPTYPGEFMPNVSDTSGENYFDRDSGLLHFTIRGSKPVDIRTSDTIIVSFQFPAMTIDEFFGEHIIQHLAAFFDLPPNKVRLVKVVRATTPARRRRKRSQQNDQAILEIGDAPQEYINDTSDLSDTQLQNISNTLINEVQLGNISNIVNATVVGVAVVDPLPAPGTPEWNATTTDSPYTIIQEASSMRFNPAPEPQHEGVVFRTQPKIQVLDAQGQPITQLGTDSQPWEITASLRPGGSNALANLTGNLTVVFVNGWANFTDLLITQFGTDFYIDFTLTVPADTNFTIASAPLTVTGRPIIASIASMTSSVIENNNFAISVELRDEVTTELIEDIAWRGHTWAITAELDKPEHHLGSLLGSTETLFSPSSSMANFYALNFTSLGLYALKLHIYTTPSGYDFYKEMQVVVRTQGQTSIVVEQTTSVVMRFDGDFNTIVGADDKAFAAMMANYFIRTYPGVLFDSATAQSGSIIVTYTVSGGISNVNSTVYGMCESIENGTSFTFNSNTITLSGYLTVGGISYYGVYCGPQKPEESESDVGKTTLVLIIALAVVSVALVAIVVAIIIWKCKVYPKTKTRDLTKYSDYDNQPKSIEDILFREQSFMSIREKSAGLPQAPAATNINSFGYNHHPEKKSPLPF